jgi:hypothetical protein
VRIRIADAGADTCLIERFLLSQTGVLDARVWCRSGRVLAAVTVLDEVGIGEDDLRIACRKALGKRHTPALFLLQRGVRRAA